MTGTRAQTLSVTIVSPSMEPTIRTGETVRVRTDLPPRVGEVAAIEHDGVLLVHRLVARVRIGRRTWYLHRGDASARCGVAAEREIAGIVPGLRRRPDRPRTLLLYQFGAVLHHLGLRRRPAPAEKFRCLGGYPG